MNPTNITIQSIRQAGNKIRVSHFRKISGYKELVPISEIRKNGWQNNIKSNGGKTTLALTTRDGKDFSATAKCSKSDNFNRKIAVAIAIGRLIKSASESGISIV